ncbi:hypothetical protein SAMN05421743_11532 [Thalassobacillus cyri]|uniref:Uncharacterized protein n=1 Tax=Thalassobacillus cyri TaxID=571932 RepID=A0A1H4GCD2_9BACI|nr:hypothetical protein [Thalassobacillus cyri]SEB07255.1 hypothetical protein SAMN05421743_11532 [Thalassobacillus cyri]
MKKIRIREKCPICQLSLEIDLNEVNKHIIVKECPAKHYKKENHPLLGTTFEYYKDNDKSNERGVGLDA